jgi:iron complex outermembrane receptor protein
MSLAGGFKGLARGWNWDLSTVYGGNRFRYDITNTDNASLGAASPRDFYAGTMIFTQHTTNLDLSRSMDLGVFSDVTVAGGAELRYDRYKIWAGEPASYINGGKTVLGGPSNGAPAAPGAQGFPGFQPSDATAQIRNNEAAYLDLEGKAGRAITLGAAARAERYSDFGSQVTGKVQGRLELIPGYAVRAAIGNGFRAPGLQQEYFSSTATNFFGGIPFDVKTFRPTSAVAAALGAQPLKPEKSVNTSIGLTAEPTRSFSVTADAYIINITDRIVFSDNFLTQAFRDTLANRGITGVGGGRFFTNAIDTKTRGLDVVARYGVGFGRAGTLRLTGGANWTKTEATKTLATPKQLSGLDAILFGPAEETRIERGQPRRTMHFNGDYEVGNWVFTAHQAYFGTVTAATALSSAPFYAEEELKGKWLTDASLSYRLQGSATLTIGANNIFDVYPDENTAPFTNLGVLRYPASSPFGFNGGYYYTKLAWTPGR